jgi:hypothetical protein
MRQITEAMEVEDASGERFGRVIAVRFDAEVAIVGVGAASLPPHQLPNLAPDLSARLCRVGYIKIEDTRYFRRDFRYYATPDQVSSVGASVLRLNRHCRDLTTTFD